MLTSKQAQQYIKKLENYINNNKLYSLTKEALLYKLGGFKKCFKTKALCSLMSKEKLEIRLEFLLAECNKNRNEKTLQEIEAITTVLGMSWDNKKKKHVYK